MVNNLKVTIAIAAYQAQSRMAGLLDSLLKQEESGFVIEEIIVHIDGNDDRTFEIAEKFDNRLIKVFNSKPRKGFAQSLKTILQQSSGDVVVTLNDDIFIEDNRLIVKLIEPYLLNQRVGLICGNPQPRSPRTFVEKAIISTFRAYERVRTKINHGDNPFCVDGKIMVFNRQFIDSFLESEDFNKMGNVDVYMYYLCKEKDFEFQFVEEAKVHFHNPSTIHDYLNWFIRNNSQKYVLSQRFSHNAISNLKFPVASLLYSCAIEFLRNPLGSLFILVCGFYIRFKAWMYGKNFENTWELVKSSKNG